MIQPRLNMIWEKGLMTQEDIDILAAVSPEYKVLILEMYPELKEIYPEKYGDE